MLFSPLHPVMVCIFLRKFVGLFIIIPFFVFMGHKDTKPRNLFILQLWIIFNNHLVRQIWLSPYPSLYPLAPKFIAPFNFVLMFIGYPLVAFKLDKKKKAEDVQGGTALMLSTAGTGLATMSFSMAGMKWGTALTKSITLSGFSVLCLTLLAPVLKRAFGREWVFAAPGVLLALEAGQAAVFLTTSPSDPQTWAALLFQLGFSFFKNTGMYLDVKVKVKALLGIQMTQEQLSEKRTDLAIIGTAHNGAEILSVGVILCILIAEAICVGIGFWDQPFMPAKFRYSGITGGWRGDIPRQQTFVLILVILVARIVATLLEEKLGSARFGPRRKHVKTYVALLIKDGAFSFRVLCYAILLAQLFIMPAELGYFGSWVLEQAEYDAKMQDDAA